MMPAGLDFNDAVVGEGALYADTNLRAFEIKSGQRILICGGSGATGSAAVQLAKYYGAEVTSVVAAKHVEPIRSLGADHVVDYTEHDFTQTAERFSRRFLRRHRPRSVEPEPALSVWRGISRSKRFVFPLPKSNREFVEFLKACLEAGQFRANIDRMYPLEAIRDAYRYVETGQKIGIVVLELAHRQRRQPTAGLSNPAGGSIRPNSTKISARPDDHRPASAW